MLFQKRGHEGVAGIFGNKGKYSFYGMEHGAVVGQRLVGIVAPGKMQVEKLAQRL